MQLFIGGAFQGKREFMKQLTGAAETEIAEAASVSDTKEYRALDHYHLRIRKQLEQGQDPVRELEQLLQEQPEIILLCDEVGMGIVPMDKRDREYREAVGRTMCVAAQKAEKVYRVICGIGEKIK
ncbi:MAG: bifunctional adenosylcobinamide kinase/adenosylcobinamide-phosphate guanylyltransferase [Lachnospiraceae bacterium]|nr:bifunctional adenosylcobinamide kinase/adenosylcobinamide-phosphate guanylyltransferase [Lachnospiraceae bacterium]